MKTTVQTNVVTTFTLTAKDVQRLIADYINADNDVNIIPDDVTFQVGNFGLVEGVKVVTTSTS